VKNLWRLYGDDGLAQTDVLAMEGETVDVGVRTCFFHPAIDYRQVCLQPARVEGLLVKVLEGGRRTGPHLSPGEEIRAARALMETHLGTFDETHKRFLNPHLYKVALTRGLTELKRRFIEGRLSQSAQ
jgi:nicotinate phosphoribosyltransferase